MMKEADFKNAVILIHNDIGNYFKSNVDLVNAEILDFGFRLMFCAEHELNDFLILWLKLLFGKDQGLKGKLVNIIFEETTFREKIKILENIIKELRIKDNKKIKEYISFLSRLNDFRNRIAHIKMGDGVYFSKSNDLSSKLERANLLKRYKEIKDDCWVDLMIQRQNQEFKETFETTKK